MMLEGKTRVLGAILLLCLIGNLVADWSAGFSLIQAVENARPANTNTSALDETLTLSDSDDDAALPPVEIMAMLIGLISLMILPILLTVSRHGPPLLQPPQTC